MRSHDGTLHFSATDLAGHLSCAHLTALDAAVARGTLDKPKFRDPLRDILRARGNLHEEAYLDHLDREGHEIVQIEDIGLNRQSADQTTAAMRDGVAIISQGVLLHERWGGRADMLWRVYRPSELGDWSYEVVDTKLARETSGASVLQLCLYADLVARVQGVVPEYIHVVTPWTDFEPQTYRTSGFFAYYRLVKRSLEESVATGNDTQTYPDPRLHCDICRWRKDCDARRRADDHLCLVAGSTKLQIKELRRQDVDTVEALAAMPLPLQWKPERGAVQTYERLREQARVQVAGRQSGEPVYEALEPEPGFGLARLPAPSAGDVFFDLEGDPFCGEGGLEYLFGWVILNSRGEAHYTAQWALSREEEKGAFEAFVDYINARWQQFPDMHIYHFGGYEPGALKRLMGRYATREEDIDRMLRAGLFVDLLGVVRGGIRASVESYSLKDLEQFHGFQRDVNLPDANHALTHVQACLDTDDVAGLTEESRSTVQCYNRDDCNSTRSLRDWLESARAGLIAEGAGIDRPAFGEGDPSAAVSEWQQKIIAPYNAQVFELQQRLPGARIGTVDKFQGQEAPVVFYSMSTSTPEEAPHGMEFPYSLNRFDVATSRARCLSVLVANPALFSPECRTLLADAILPPTPLALSSAGRGASSEALAFWASPSRSSSIHMFAPANCVLKDRIPGKRTCGRWISGTDPPCRVARARMA